MRTIVEGQIVLGETVTGTTPITVTTSSAQRTVRVFVRDTLACTIWVATPTQWRASWAALYQSRELARWRRQVERAALAVIVDVDLDTVAADPVTGAHEAVWR